MKTNRLGFVFSLILNLMQQASVQKFGKVLLVSLAGLLAFWLLLFFVMMFVSQGRGNVGSWHNGMMRGQDVIFQDGASRYEMMDGQGVSRGIPSDETTAMPAQKMMLGNDGVAPVDDGDISFEEKKVMKNGTLDIRVQSADEALGRIREIALAQGGSIANSDFYQGTDNVKSGSVTVKVPVAKFEEAFLALKKVATLVESESIAGTDVTEQYIDLSARLKNKQAQEIALQNLLNRAEKVSDIIDITRELGTVRGEIESLEGQLRYLGSQTDMASITIFITEDTRVAPDQAFRPGQTLAESLKALLTGLGYFVNGIIALAIVGIPIFFVYGLILWGVFLGVRKLVKKFWD